ncbi:unnamed protein product [Prorocentrum cordatum]|uniref:Uncharacterized protein n=1 Tax=Prorocentrum cordatum TaxID=2364126 RepID=A0ABN9VDL0_9DINO|nr:unnamed protein product [Polarella glacialis]
MPDLTVARFSRDSRDCWPIEVRAHDRCLSYACASVPSIFGSAALDHACVAYVVWVLFGVLAFVTHLGDDLLTVASSCVEHWDSGSQPVRLATWSVCSPGHGRLLAAFASLLPASGRGSPGRSVDSWAAFRNNVALAAVFVGQHSLMRWLKGVEGATIDRVQPRALRMPLRWMKSRVAYNMFSALTLHVFLIKYLPYRSEEFILGFVPSELELPISAGTHALFALMVMIPCFGVFLADPGTHRLLYGDALDEGGKGSKASSIDAITQMAHSVHKRAGLLGFILFSGMSIVPKTIYIDDVVVRVVAAVYLRQRSPHFRMFSRRVAGSHEAAWAVRAMIPP